MKRFAAAKRGQSPSSKSTRTLKKAVHATTAITETLEARQMLALNYAHPGIIFAPGTDIKALTASPTKPGKGGIKVGSANNGPEPYILNNGGRWSTTATNGGGLQQGQPTTLRWSVVNDGVNVPNGIGEGAGASNLKARLNAIYGNQATWQPIIQQALDNWGANSGLTYVFEPNDDGAALFGSAGVIGVRGDVRISGKTIDGNSNVLAYNNFPASGGDMVIDTADNTFNNTGGASIIFRNVLTHEQGHGIGLNHVEPVNNTKLMEPFLSTAFTGAQFDDTLAANRLYGDRLEKIGAGNDVFGNATGLGSLNNGTVNTSTISIDGTSDQDWFSFSVTGDKSTTVTVTPFGGFYASYQQGSGGTAPNFNATAQGDLTLTLLASNGSTVLATSNLGVAGTTEQIANFNISAGTYFIRVTSSINLAQMYNLSTQIANATINGSFTAVSPDPRTTAVTSVNINFSEAVNGFDIGDLTLTRDGFSESLAGGSLTGGPQNFTLNLPASATERVGQYTLRVVAAGSGITAQSNGNGLNNDIVEVWTMQGLNGTGGNDALKIAKNAGNSALTDVFYNSGSVSYSYITTNINQLIVTGGAGDDVFTVDFTNGSPLPNSGATFDGGAHTTGDTIRHIGQAPSDVFSMGVTFVTRTSPVSALTSMSNTETIDIAVGTYTSAQDLNGFNLIVNNQGVAQLNNSQHLASLTINDGGRANIGLNGNRILATSSLAIGATGLLDMFDNDLLLEYTGGSPADQVQDWITAGRSGGSWLGFGIVSTAARNAFPIITTLGMLEGSQYDAMRGAGTLFTGENPDATSVLVKYTYYGDTDFNGRVNFDDYSRVDGGFLSGLTGWMNGDTNDDGAINFDDYALIDQAFLGQGAVTL